MSLDELTDEELKRLTRMVREADVKKKQQDAKLRAKAKGAAALINLFPSRSTWRKISRNPIAQVRLYM